MSSKKDQSDQHVDTHLRRSDISSNYKSAVSSNLHEFASIDLCGTGCTSLPIEFTSCQTCSINGELLQAAHSKPVHSACNGTCTDNSSSASCNVVEDRLSRSVELGQNSLRNEPKIMSYVPNIVGQTLSNQGLSLSKSNYGFKSNLQSGEHSRDELKSTNPVEHGEKLKTSLLSAWNNVAHGWTLRMKTSFKCNVPIYLLGKQYVFRESAPFTQLNGLLEKRSRDDVDREYETFKQDFVSRIWFTYRREFPTIDGSQLKTDIGWGCMLRTGQMILAQALLMHHLRRDFVWQLNPNSPHHLEILRLFGDNPNRQRHPFSLHQLVHLGQEFGKRPGDWFGPSSVAYILRDAFVRATVNTPLLLGLRIYVAPDCTVYKQDVLDQCCEVVRKSRRSSSIKSSSGLLDSLKGAAASQSTPDELIVDVWHALIILIPVRLGGDKINPVYFECLKKFLTIGSCLGIIGGKPKHSLYFVGYQDDKLIYLDPHFCQEAIDVTREDFPVHSFHCFTPKKTSFSDMDPTCTVGFYCRTRDDFERFCEEGVLMATPSAGKVPGIYPIFAISEERNTVPTCNGDAGHSADKPLTTDCKPQAHFTGARATSKRGSRDDYVLL